MYTTHNERKFVFPERFIRTLKNKIYKYMISISKNVCIDKLDEILGHILTLITSGTYIDFNKENNKEGPKFKVGDIVRISKYKNIFAKGKRLYSKLV